MKINKDYFMDHIMDLAKEYCEHGDSDQFEGEVNLLLEEAGEGLNSD